MARPPAAPVACWMRWRAEGGERSARSDDALHGALQVAQTGPLMRRTDECRSVPPEIFEPHRTQLRVPGRVRDRNVPQPVLDRPGVDAIVGKLVAARMPQHVKVCWQR